MKELDLLIENYLTESFETSDLFRLVEQVMDEQSGCRSGRGVQLEYAIIYWALKSTNQEDELQQRISENPCLLEYGEGQMREEAISAVEAASSAGANIRSVYHSSEKDIKGDPEPKTDILIGQDRVSVKMRGGIQLTSSEGRRTAKMFQIVFDEMMQDPEFKSSLEEEVVNKMIENISNIPTKMIDPKNLQKALKARPSAAMAMLRDGSLIDENNWKIWEAQNKKSLTNEIVNFLENSPEFKYRLIEEAMTGKRVFGRDNPAAADHIMTPTYYGPIDSSYIKKAMANTKIQIRAKSRKGITSATLRFDLPDASKMAASQVLEEGVRDTITKWFSGFKNILKRFARKESENIIDSIVDDLDFNIV
jgi:hypothetical protein